MSQQKGNAETCFGKPRSHDINRELKYKEPCMQLIKKESLTSRCRPAWWILWQTSGACREITTLRRCVHPALSSVRLAWMPCQRSEPLEALAGIRAALNEVLCEGNNVRDGPCLEKVRLNRKDRRKELITAFSGGLQRICRWLLHAKTQRCRRLGAGGCGFVPPQGSCRSPALAAATEWAGVNLCPDTGQEFLCPCPLALSPASCPLNRTVSGGVVGRLVRLVACLGLLSWGTLISISFFLKWVH